MSFSLFVPFPSAVSSFTWFIFRHLGPGVVLTTNKLFFSACEHLSVVRSGTPVPFWFGSILIAGSFWLAPGSLGFRVCRFPSNTEDGVEQWNSGCDKKKKKKPEGNWAHPTNLLWASSSGLSGREALVGAEVV